MVSALGVVMEVPLSFWLPVGLEPAVGAAMTSYFSPGFRGLKVTEPSSPFYQPLSPPAVVTMLPALSTMA